MALPPVKPGFPLTDTADGRRLQAVIAEGKSDPEAIRTLRCRTVAQGRLHQLNYIRDLPPQPVMEDEPDGLLGETTAPNASEALLAAFGSCLSIGIHANALAQGIPIRALELNVEADINTTAAWGTGDLHPKTIGFEAIRVSVKLDADASRKVLDAIVKHAVLWSPVANTLHNPVHLDVTLQMAPRA
ncbi:OsmC family protein [Methylobacterium sp. J-076]|uniref:OsmC family protein n=1 Tax=Methylobacterium sp. J-076 TaxID=2836655 RepID=UPI001FBA04F8|nr:OsmC family protein [Methylobacterium sp. J-076]MCJ2015606.1 OsmC family protein [Methylobacterium sp. J-076]